MAGALPGSCQRQHLKDLDDGDLADVENALEFIVNMLLKIRPSLVTDLKSLAEGFEKLNNRDRWASISFSSAGAVGFGISLAKLTGYTVSSYGTPLAIGVGMGQGLTSKAVELSRKWKEEKLAEILKREEVNYKELENQLGILLKFEKLCLMHDDNEAANKFFKAFGSSSKRTTAGYYGKLIQGTHSIHADECGIVKKQNWAEVTLDECGQMVTKIVSSYTPEQVQKLVHSVIPNIVEAMKVVATDNTLKIALTAAAVPLVHDTVLKVGTENFMTNMAQQPLGEGTARVLEHFGCYMDYAKKGKRFKLVMDKCELADKLMDGGGFTKTCEEGNKIVLKSKNFDIANATTRQCASKYASEYCKMSYETFTKLCTIATGVVCLYGIYNECHNILSKWKQEGKEGPKLRRVAEAINEAVETKKLTRVEWG